MKPALFLALLMAAVAPLGAQTAERPAITGVAFARFYTTQPNGAEKFYGDTLGYKRLETKGMWVYPVNSSQWIEVLTSPPPPPTTASFRELTKMSQAELEKTIEAAFAALLAAKRETDTDAGHNGVSRPN